MNPYLFSTYLVESEITLTEFKENDVRFTLLEPEKKEQRAESKIDCLVQENAANNAESLISSDG